MNNRNEENNYRWDYREYSGNYGQNPNRDKTGNRGLRVFLALLGAVILLCGLFCIGMAVLERRQPASQPPAVNGELEHLPEINQENKPQENLPQQTEDGRLTPVGIYKKCAASVVGVVSNSSSST